MSDFNKFYKWWQETVKGPYLTNDQFIKTQERFNNPKNLKNVRNYRTISK